MPPNFIFKHKFTQFKYERKLNIVFKCQIIFLFTVSRNVIFKHKFTRKSS